MPPASHRRVHERAIALRGGDWPDHFFEVTVRARHIRHAASTLPSTATPSRTTCAQVWPVPLAPAFPLAAQITDFLSEHTNHFVFNVRLAPDTTPITRPFGATLRLTDDYAAAYERLETRLIPRLDDGDPAAVLWLAHTPYAGSIPRQLGVRGLRARSGNIQIGSDDVFRHLFHETRFNGWCVGEVHIVDSRIVPNGRRDYFEPGPHLRNLENHLGGLAYEISARCSPRILHRNRLRQAEVTLRQVNPPSSSRRVRLPSPRRRHRSCLNAPASRCRASKRLSTNFGLTFRPRRKIRSYVIQTAVTNRRTPPRPVEFDRLSPRFVSALRSGVR